MFNFARKHKRPLDLLLLVWLLMAVFLPSTPIQNVHDGLRHFLVFLVPFSYFAALGIEGMSHLVEEKLGLKKERLLLIIGILVIGMNIGHIVKVHPYQTTFFNVFAGGLKGAQEKQIPYAFDYWHNSYREAVGWVNQHAGKNSFMLVINADSRAMMNYYDLREDIKSDFIQKLPIPRNSYVVVPTRTGWPNMKESFLERIYAELKTLAPVYQISRQGGKILTIYYKS